MKRLPNILSFSRILMAPLFMWMYLEDDLLIRFLGIVVFVIAALTDLLDGYLARRYGIESVFGVFIDPLADKLLTFAGFICLPFIDSELYPWWAVWLIVGRDVGITALRLFADRRGMMLQTRSSAKVKTFAQMVFLYLALILGVAVQSEHPLLMYAGAIMSSWAMYWLMMGITALTVYSGLEYLFVNRTLLSTASGTSTRS